MSNQEENIFLTVNNYQDIPLLKVQTFNINDNLDIMKKMWEPELTFNFSANLYHCYKSQIKFQCTWFKEYTWLVHSQVENSAYCKYCIFFALPNIRKSKS